MIWVAVVLVAVFAVAGFLLAGRRATNNERLDGVWKGALLALVIAGIIAGASRGCSHSDEDPGDHIRGRP